MTPRLRALAGGLVLLAALVAVALVDAGRRRPRSGPDHEAAVSLGLPDLVLSSAERWLRHPSQAEPESSIDKILTLSSPSTKTLIVPSGSFNN